SWGSASSVTVGTCATPVLGASIGSKRSCTVLGLAASTAYQFQVVAFRGTLNLNAVFGALSNVASGTTLADPNPPVLPPPPPPSAGGVWPNEATGSRVLNVQPWDRLTGLCSNYLRRA